MDETNRIAKNAGLLSLIEIGLGSLLHGFKIPFAGHILSLNQGFILSRACLESQTKFVPTQVSNIAALLKSLSPAGKKLTPMLALSVQGLLFNLSTLFLGNNFLGITFGMLTLSLWGFIQPILLYYIFFGENLISMFNFYYNKIQSFIAFDIQDLLLIVTTLVGIKMILAIAISVISLRMKKSSFLKYQHFFSKKQNANKKSNNNFHAALKDTLNPTFVLSLTLTFLFLYFSQSEFSEIIWGILRPISIAFILFYTFRWLPLEKIKSPIFQKSLKFITDLK